ncbi:DNA polymerase III subunit epsilon [Candidatus Venteria ishoeyi]|uniref:DNA polymerase III subunit epsilon n=1 Tax=Candidatus Venteria ishoeyi TaxID=1899563 RepID=A0A1H6FIA2_9GAMM|nr:DNA polymerase III subunit epsilon [Candidatus Venteria ishoeyi]MDM8545568.1 DNA polymerase III subunit epsilon [Candidatus Venteria ishoeyi]SEH08856.1 DNA polymerase III subunit epsilon [Candidatus Venteria ishoeyi]
MRQVVLDTETTGINHKAGHKIIEIGCVELLDRRLTGKTYHEYLQPDREIDEGAIRVHGINNEFLQGKPRFSDIKEAFLAFIQGAELIIHNAPFDVGFINHELHSLDANAKTLEHFCTVTDTLVMARKKHPGQKNNLDALCKRYDINNSHRDLHGALLDSEILADVYLAMTGGQTTLFMSQDNEQADASAGIRPISTQRTPLPLIQPTDEELAAHQKNLELIDKASDGACIWKSL